jgi:hypothetical protein
MSVFGRAARGVAVGLANLIKGGDVKRSYFDGAVHKVQATMLDPDDVDTMPVYGDQGVAFRIPVDAEVLVAHAMADAGLGTVIGTSQRGKRPTEKPGGGEVPEGAGGLHVLGSWRVYCDDAGNIYVGDIHAGTFEKMARADLVDAEIQRLWDLLTTWAVVAQDGGAALQTQAITDAALVATTAADTVYGK